MLEEAWKIKEVDVSEMNIGSLAGIEYFRALETLICRENSLRELDVSKNPALIVLNCMSNPIDKLDVSNNTELTQLNCGMGNLTELDVSHQTSLSFLACFLNRMTRLDASKMILNELGTYTLYCGYQKDEGTLTLTLPENMKTYWNENLSKNDFNRNVVLAP